MTDTAFTLEAIDVTVQYAPCEVPVKTSFGVMTHRPAIFVRVRDTSGATGYGEVWCNFPTFGAPHRAQIVTQDLSPRVVNRTFDDAPALWRHLTEALSVLVLQTGEPGPIAQAISGLDLAIWDMLARRAGQPLWRYLGGTEARVPVYASGINPSGAEATGAGLLAQGHRRLKLKVGFDAQADLANARALRALLGPDAELMLDANQGWTVEAADHALRDLAAVAPYWVEEPVRVDTPPTAWRTLRHGSGLRLAGGENFSDLRMFDDAIAGDWLDVIQPDICKWGGISQARDIFLRAKAAGKLTCPHTLGGGVALAGSMHLWAGIGGTGFVEMDGNDNALREDICPCRIEGGAVTLTDAPGLGVDTDRLDAMFAK